MLPELNSELDALFADGYEVRIDNNIMIVLYKRDETSTERDERWLEWARAHTDELTAHQRDAIGLPNPTIEERATFVGDKRIRDAIIELWDVARESP